MSRPHGPPTWYGILGAGVLSLAVAAILGLIGWLVITAGFDQLREYRQLERTPRSLVAAVLPGEVHLNGAVELADDVLQAPDSGSAAVFYRYRVERESRDSDGNTEWRTVHDESRYVDFVLRDDSGAIAVQPNERVDFDAPERSHRRDGDMRYTEYRIDPGDPVFVFGSVDLESVRPRVEFDSAGQYQPIVSASGAESVHTGMLTSTLLLLWFGLLVSSFAIYALLWGLRVHLSVVYLAVLSIAMAFALVGLSMQAARADLRDSFTRAARDVAAANTLLADRLADAGVDWDGDWNSLEAPPRHMRGDDRRIVEHLQQRIALQLERTEAIRRQWPERWVAAGLNLPALPEIAHAELEIDPAHANAQRGRALSAQIIAGTMLLVATVLAWYAFRRVRLKRTIENLPTSRIAGVAWGLTELHGTVALARQVPPLIGPLSGRECVWYHYVVQERRRSGKKTRWVTIQDDRIETAFRLVDGDDEMPVDPTGAEAVITCGISERRGERRYSEHWIQPGTPLYVLGSAEVDPATGDSLRVVRGAAEQPFLISDLGEGALMLRKARSAFLLLNLGVNAGNAAALAMLAALSAMHGAGFLAAALVPLGFFAVFLLILIYNDLIMLRQRVRRAWANIEVSLMKRADLVPQLQAVLQGYFGHERELQQQLAQLRALTGQPHLPPAAAGELVAVEQRILERLRALREAHPNLEADAPAVALMRSLAQLETEVALMREGYNQSVERYNTRSQQLPELILARSFGFSPAEMFRSGAR